MDTGYKKDTNPGGIFQPGSSGIKGPTKLQNQIELDPSGMFLIETKQLTLC